MVFIPGLYQGSIPHLRAEDTDEERRLLYVALTRAQSLLYLSFPAKNGNGGTSNEDFLIEDNHKLSVFVEQPEVGNLLATRGGPIEADVLAAILNRVAPTKEEIVKCCLNLYVIQVVCLTGDHPCGTKIGLRARTTEILRISHLEQELQLNFVNGGLKLRLTQ